MSKKRTVKRMFCVILSVMTVMLFAKPVEAQASQEKTSDITQTLSVSYTDIAGVVRNLVFTVKCTYTAVWDEGYGGGITEAIFWEATNAASDGVPVALIKEYSCSQTKGDRKYMDYRARDLIVRVYVGVDEWGDVSLWAQ